MAPHPHHGTCIWYVALIYWDQVTHICVSKLTIIRSDYALTPGRHQAIVQTNARILLIWPLGTNFSKAWISIHTFSFKNEFEDVVWEMTAILYWTQRIKGLDSHRHGSCSQIYRTHNIQPPLGVVHCYIDPVINNHNAIIFPSMVFGQLPKREENATKISSITLY